jgi:UDP-N-acetylglucosamine acyltransferase
MEDTTPYENKKQHATLNASYKLTLKGGSNYIHPTAIIEGEVVLGENNYIGAFCYITGNTIIGNNNRFEAFCSIGTEPEHKEYFGKQNQGVVIGNDNTFREYVTINAGCEKPTILYDNIVMLKASHIGHDSTIHSNCTLACNVIIAGHTLIGKYVNMGLGSVCHQYSRIGSGSMIGMGTVITKKVNPKCFGLYVGTPPRCVKQNTHLKNKFTESEIQEIINEFETLKL